MKTRANQFGVNREWRVTSKSIVWAVVFSSPSGDVRLPLVSRPSSSWSVGADILTLLRAGTFEIGNMMPPLGDLIGRNARARH